MNIRYVNLTPHVVNVELADGRKFAFEPTKPEARMSVASSQASFNGYESEVPLTMPVFGEVINLPEPVAGVAYIVGTMLAQRVMRSDVVSPDTGKTAIRNEAGQVVAVRGFQKFA